jgi:anthranilate phosphoribosyltransferase
MLSPDAPDHGGEMSPVMTAAILTGLRVKKETIGEITAAAR